MLFSYSRLKKFEDCPRAWYNKYILDKEEPPTEAQVTGKVVHKALELCIKGANPDRAFIKAILGEAVLGIDFNEAKRMFDRGLQYLQGLKTAGASSENWQAELHFQLPLASDDPFSPELQVYIDFLDENFYMIDWKTGFKVYKPTDNQQLGLYAWAISQEYDRDFLTATLYFLRTGTYKSRYYSKEEMEEARTWALTLAQDIEQRIIDLEMGEGSEKLFPATPGIVCKYCGFARECRSGEKQQTETGTEIGQTTALIPGVPQTHEQAEKLAGEIMQLEAVVKAMKDGLKKWVKAQGPVIVDDQQWDFWPSTRWEFTPDQKKAAATAIVNSGRNPWEYLAFGSTQINKLKKDLGWTDETLKSLGGVPKSTKSFKNMKVVEKPENNRETA